MQKTGQHQSRTKQNAEKNARPLDWGCGMEGKQAEHLGAAKANTTLAAKKCCAFVCGCMCVCSAVSVCVCVGKNSPFLNFLHNFLRVF